MTTEPIKKGWWQRMRERIGRILLRSHRRKRRKIRGGYYYL